MQKPTLSATAQALLTEAISHPDGVAKPPARLPIAAQRAVVQSLIKGGLLEEITGAEGDQRVWRTSDDGQHLSLRVTAAGLEAVGSPAIPVNSLKQHGEQVKTTTRRPTIRMAAQAMLEAWDESPGADLPNLEGAVSALRTLLTSSPSDAPRQLRADTKRARVLALLRRDQGATIAQVVEVTGWATHTVRGFFAGLKKKGHAVEVLDRVRQVGSGNQGAKGSYTVYRVAEAG